jgi:CRISPR-associated endonuclease/helicase Cas3
MARPTEWPDWLDAVWAKSAERGQANGETLAEHTWLVLKRMADLQQLRPGLAADPGPADLWARLFWVCLLHDLGKCAPGFQAKLRGHTETQSAREWGLHRHEVFSLAFVDWVFPASDKQLADARRWVISGIASHHKDSDKLQTLYDPEAGDADIDAVLRSVPLETVRGLHRWLSRYAWGWAAALGLPHGGWGVLPAEEEAVSHFHDTAAQHVRQALNAHRRWTRTLHSQPDPTPAEILLRGLVTQADHTASAHVGPIHGLRCDAQVLLNHWQGTAEQAGRTFQPFAHQMACRSASGSAMLIAPTGSGKTEAALLWTAAQTNAPRMFYTLPYQASMNAMWRRLSADLSDQQVGLAHGRALLALYRLISDETPDHATAAKQARRRKNLARLRHPPVQIFSPYQMLKAAYRLKGYEGMITDFDGAAFVFDEIHAYDAGRLALITGMIRYLRERHHARFLVMSATFPALVRDVLRDALGAPVEVSASPELYAAFCRHRVQVLPDELFAAENWARVRQDIASGRMVLICCNTISRAQQARIRVGQDFPDANVILLHGRLTGRDRMTREAALRAAAGSGSVSRAPIVLIATQVVEVSLDIDLDTIYTDPAPLEALIQRFGRVNRRRLQAQPAPVHVFERPDDGQRIYEPALVQGALRVLTREHDRPVQEDQVGVWLDEIYQGRVRTEWLKRFEDGTRIVERVLLRGLRPFQSDDATADDFYKAFDGMDVLPAGFESEYQQLLEDEPVRAQELFVSIRSFQAGVLRARGKLRKSHDRYTLIADVPYDNELGLDIYAR